MNIKTLLFICLAASGVANASNVVSYVDLNPKDSHKIVLRVDGNPYFMTNIQVRLDKLRYDWDWSASTRDAIIKQAAEDGFNTVAIPIHWREVEPTKDNFSWTILDEYMSLCKKYGLKMEMLWFSWSSGGRIQWLDKDRNLLRTPDYVCTPQGTSEYTILRKTDPWTLDWYDTDLRDRETYVLSKIMEHIAEWDAAEGNPYTVIGVQFGNESLGHEQDVPAEDIIDYYNLVGSAVKDSEYSVWTRLNCVNGRFESYMTANEALRENGGTNIDIVGIDVYGTNPINISEIVPYIGKNYRMIMGSGAEVSIADVYQMAALYGNTAYVHYDMCGPDNHGLYSQSGSNGFVPKSHVEKVRNLNKLMKGVMTDLATNAMGYGLFVYNMEGNSSTPTENPEGIVFDPKTSSSQAISIRRSGTETRLLSTKGGKFTYPESLGVTAASKGYFDDANNWVDEGSLQFSSTSITAPEATIIKITHAGEEFKKPEAVSQAEFANIGDGAEISTAYSGKDGFACHGYVKTLEQGFVEWNNVDGLSDGKVALGFRYAVGNRNGAEVSVTVNGIEQKVSLPPSGGFNTFSMFYLPVTIDAGTTNTIKLQATGTRIYVDELHVYADDGSFSGVESVGLEADGALVYPNPANDVLYLPAATNSTPVDILICDMSGKTVMAGVNANGVIDISGLQSGYYIIKADNESALFLKQ